jgi:hypothetical protein
MKNQNEKIQFEIQTNEYIKKIADLEFENSLLTQKNALLEKQLESLTTKYNELKKELFDIEEHINFCKDNQIKIINYNQNEINKNIKEINPNNFYAFKNKIKILFEYNDNFMNTDSEITVFNMIIDNITDIKTENLSLRKALEDLKNIIDKNNFNNNINNNYNNINMNNNLNNINNNNLNNNIGMNNDLFINNEEQKMIRNNNRGFTYDITNTNDFESNFTENFENSEQRFINSKRNLNNLMNNLDNLQNVFKTNKDSFNLNKNNNIYPSSYNKPRLYHKYI